MNRIEKMESMKSSYDTTYKGLENKYGKNNCYLNVVIQSLWHLMSFRINFLSFKTHRHSDKELYLRFRKNTILSQRQMSSYTD